jgi:dinuclear metal center YbgI/SA1388 family protein
MPAALSDILAEADSLLQAQAFEDYCVNGLQVPGPEQVQTLVSGVSANAELFSLAVRERADLLVVHHGLFWGSGVRALDPVLGRRLKLLLEADIALAAYHLPLDAHPQIGNNALLARALGVGELRPFAEHGDRTIGFVGRLGGEDLTVGELAGRLAAATGREPLLLEGGPARVAEVALVTGGGADYIPQAAAAGAQVLVTGEPEERAAALAREHGVHLLAGGHHATEKFGIRALGEHLAERFGLRHVFIDVPNPV